jgi:antitoxin component of MazEF toxin-antitoxin module
MYLRTRNFILFLLSFAFTTVTANAQDDSCHLQISLLTCSPGTELYSTFGHSALRVTDRKAGTDIIYNYGTFDFYDPAFLLKFTRGQLLYYLDQQDFGGFLRDYMMENRSVYEQVLALDCNQKSALQQALFVNMQEENRRYRYDFLFDNCTTRLRELILKQPGTTYTTGTVIPFEGATFRNHIHYYLDNNHQYWSKLGIDILLGSKMDRVMSNSEAMFLPDYLEKGIDSSRSSSVNLVLRKNILFQRSEASFSSDGFLTRPVVVFSLFTLAAIIISLLKNPLAKKFTSTIDFLIFFLNGLLGCFLIFMWFGTDHNTTQNNLNILWALPTHIVMAFMIRKKRNLTGKYFMFVAVLNLLLILGWALLPQQLNTALIPWVILTGWRSWSISKSKLRA